jgi:hypothetical protein
MFNLGGATLGLGMLLVLGTACAGSAGSATTPVPFETVASEASPTSVARDPDVPQLPFPDNPDPNARGIPTSYGGFSAWVNGVYRGQIVEPTVLLYDSHDRIHITGAVPSGTEVQVELYQANPVLDFYVVRAETPAGPQSAGYPHRFFSAIHWYEVQFGAGPDPYTQR